MITAEQIMTLAGYVLQDESAVRWSYPELASWISEATSAIVLAKPSATATTVQLNLQAGTLQQIPSDYVAFLRLVRNLSSLGPPAVGGRAIRVTERDTLDATAPYWHDPKCVPYRKEVKQFVFDDEDRAAYYVYPGNDGTGIVEGICAAIPAAIVADGDATVLASYGQAVGLPGLYQAPIVDYVVYRAMSKDATTGNAQVAAAHFQAFATAIGMATKVEAANSPNAPSHAS